MSDNKFYGKIEKINCIFKNQSIYVEGYAFIDGINIEKREKIKKSMIFSNGKKSYVIRAENVLRKDITELYGKKINNYNYAGFKCSIDLGFIDEMKPLSNGKWQFYMYINADGYETEKKMVSFNNFKESSLFSFCYKNKIKEFSIIKEKSKIFVLSEEYIRATSIMYKTNIFHKSLGELIKKQSVVILYNFLCKVFSVRKNRITFLSDSREGLYGNFKFVYNELINRGIKDIKTMLKPQNNTKKTLIEKLKLIYYLSTSSCILLDDSYSFIYNIIPREKTKLIQLWHAPGAFKTFGFSRAGKSGWPTEQRVKNHKNYTNAIVSSKSVKNIYAEAYGIAKEKIIATGIPRTDMFFDNEYIEERKKIFYDKYPFVKNKKVILFAPTYRGEGRGGYYNFENLNLEKLKNSLKDDYVFIMKMHPFVDNIPDYSNKYENFMINLTEEHEINDILLVSDILITDYSSVCFEFSLLNRPIIFFAYDLKEYIRDRDFYYPYETFVPGPIVKTTEEIIKIIKEQNFQLNKLDTFRKKFFDDFDGKSSKRVVDLILYK